MKFKWTEPLKAKRARVGGFFDIFRKKGIYITVGAFMVLFTLIWLMEGKVKIPLADAFLFGFIFAAPISLIIYLIAWALPNTIIVSEEGINNEIGGRDGLDKWADISDVRIEQRHGWQALAYTARGIKKNEWGISKKISTQELLNFMQRQIKH
jgi:hypothetical protein